jgi:hypothetical protein
MHRGRQGVVGNDYASHYGKETTGHREVTGGLCILSEKGGVRFTGFEMFAVFNLLGGGNEQNPTCQHDRSDGPI